MRSISNRIFLKISGKWFRAYSIVKHVGRSSGRHYRNPVSAYPIADGFVIAVLYGAESHWVRNVMAAGRFTLQTKGHDYLLERPEIIAARQALPAFPALYRRMLRSRKTGDFVWAHRAEALTDAIAQGGRARRRAARRAVVARFPADASHARYPRDNARPDFLSAPAHKAFEPPMYRFTGETLMLIGALHILAGLLSQHGPLADIARDGVFDAVGSHTDRQAAVWFLVTGAAMLLFGYFTRWAQRQTGTLPVALGWSLLAIAGVGLVLMPLSGFWLIIPAAVLALAAARHHSDPAARNQTR